MCAASQSSPGFPESLPISVFVVHWHWLLCSLHLFRVPFLSCLRLHNFAVLLGDSFLNFTLQLWLFFCVLNIFFLAKTEAFSSFIETMAFAHTKDANNWTVSSLCHALLISIHFSLCHIHCMTQLWADIWAGWHSALLQSDLGFWSFSFVFFR